MSATMPSRDFLVQQSVLNYMAREFPGHMSQGASRCAAWLFDTDIAVRVRVPHICREFRKITSRYGVSP